MLQTLVVHVENKPGVLNRVASLFRRRAYNIESLTVGHTEKPGVSRMTITVDTDQGGAERLEAHLYKLVNMLHVQNVTHIPVVCRELALIKVASTQETRTGLLQIAATFRARVVDMGLESLMIEATGTEDKVDSLVEVLQPYGIMEMVRTGRVAMCRGPHTVNFHQLSDQGWDEAAAVLAEHEE
jgi:acetolactate synthase-1/3 small subunit